MSEQQVNSSIDVKSQEIDLVRLMEIKNQMTSKAHGFYRALSEYIVKLPINPQMKQRALNYFDDGFLWVGEGIRCAELKLSAPIETKKLNQAKAEKSEAEACQG